MCRKLSVAWVELGGTIYKCGAFVVTSSELLPQFSQIVDIVVTVLFLYVKSMKPFVFVNITMHMK